MKALTTTDRGGLRLRETFRPQRAPPPAPISAARPASTRRRPSTTRHPSLNWLRLVVSPPLLPCCVPDRRLTHARGGICRAQPRPRTGSVPAATVTVTAGMLPCPGDVANGLRSGADLRSAARDERDDRNPPRDGASGSAYSGKAHVRDVCRPGRCAFHPTHLCLPRFVEPVHPSSSGRPGDRTIGLWAERVMNLVLDDHPSVFEARPTVNVTDRVRSVGSCPGRRPSEQRAPCLAQGCVW